MEEFNRSNNKSSKLKVVVPEARIEMKKLSLTKIETQEDLKNALKKIKDLMRDLSDSELSQEDIIDLNQSIKNLHEYVTELNIDQMKQDDEMKELENIERLFKEKMVLINKDQLN